MYRSLEDFVLKTKVQDCVLVSLFAAWKQNVKIITSVALRIISFLPKIKTISVIQNVLQG